jgi:hypothetical protein
MPSNPLYPFLLRTLIWLPLSFAFWYQAANLLSLPLATISRFALHQAAPALISNVELGDHKLTFVTPFEAETPAGEAQNRRGVIVVEINPLIYGYSLPLLIALLFAAEGLSVSWSKLFIAYVGLLPFQAWGVCFEFLKTVAFELGPTVATQVNFPQWAREGIALGYQFGYLILPPISTAVLWIAMNRNFLNRLLDRSQPVTG